MEKIFFDYKIDLARIAEDNKTNYKIFELYQLKGLCYGHIYIFFDYNNRKKRNFMLLETGILDYILQFDMLFSYNLDDKDQINLVSGDYYSNSLDFTYIKATDNLEIYDVNNALYTINCKYKDFKKAYEKFRKKVLNELIIFYPELDENPAFLEHFGQIPKQNW